MRATQVSWRLPADADATQTIDKRDDARTKQSIERPQTGKAGNGKPTKKLEKPRPDFPLFPLATGRWAKKIRGKTHDVGSWGDPHGALQLYRDQKRFGVVSLRFDPFQAELLSQILRSANIHTEEVPFVGKNLSVMASKLIETFRAGQIEVYRDEKLIRDLSRLTIVERSFGYKLEAALDLENAQRATYFS